MLINGHKQRNIVADLSANQHQRIKDFIQGAVYCYCKNKPNMYFAARDLFGGENYRWEGTALIDLYKWHVQNSNNDPVGMAGKDIGWLLLDVIIEDKREFELREKYTHEYKWRGIEVNP